MANLKEKGLTLSSPLRLPMSRPGLGTRGKRVSLLTNHFKVDVNKLDGFFYHYSVALFYEDGRPVDGKGLGRKLLDQVSVTYNSQLGGKEFAYDGDRSLFTMGSLPGNKLEFTVVLENVKSGRSDENLSPKREEPRNDDRKRLKRQYQSKIFEVQINYAARIPVRAIANALKRQEYERSQEALRVLDIILRQHAAKQGCLIVRQSYFHDDPKNFSDVGGGVIGCRGFHSSFRTSQSGLSLNLDVSTTMIVKPGPVIDFLLENQNVRDPSQIDWSKAKRTLKNLMVKTLTSNQQFKIYGLSEKICRDQLFSLKQKTSDPNGEFQTVDITVYDYFVKHKEIKLAYSAHLPCIDVGKPKHPVYFPVELCTLVPLQRYRRALNSFQRASLVEKSRQNPRERMNVLSRALQISDYDAEPMLRSCGVSISKSFTPVEGRVLMTPKLKVGSGEDLFPRNGRWNFNNKKLISACKLEHWAVVNFSVRHNITNLVNDLIKIGRMKGVVITQPFCVVEEDQKFLRAPAVTRVDKMFEILKSRLPGMPVFLLCLLPERKNSSLYGPWKKKCLSDYGVVTQCLSPTNRINDQYLTNLLLKINAKLGGLNSALVGEILPNAPIPKVSKFPTMIMGMDVSHGAPGQADFQSIAAVVSSRKWPSISHYRASVRTQSSKVEMIDSLFKLDAHGSDAGMMREALVDFYASCGRKPEHIIIFRDGVSESQFSQVLNIEFNQMLEACKFLDQAWSPKFVLVIAQKNHHTRFFQNNSPENVAPGTVIDNQVCHPRNYDFYMCAHAGMIGTSRPTHYHVLLDQVGFSPDDMQELVHSLSYVYQRSTTAVSIVAPVCYAHLAAAQLGQWMKFEQNSETPFSQGGGSISTSALVVPAMPPLEKKVKNSMFFC